MGLDWMSRSPSDKAIVDPGENGEEKCKFGFGCCNFERAVIFTGGYCAWRVVR